VTSTPFKVVARGAFTVMAIVGALALPACGATDDDDDASTEAASTKSAEKSLVSVPTSGGEMVDTSK
jgi:ABC-type enterochelin transport system substrate-binding protein